MLAARCDGWHGCFRIRGGERPCCWLSALHPSRDRGAPYSCRRLAACLPRTGAANTRQRTLAYLRAPPNRQGSNPDAIGPLAEAEGPGAYGYLPCLSGLGAVRLGGDPRDSTVVSRWDRRRPKTIGENLRRCQGGWLGGGSPKGEPPNHLDIGVKSDPPPRHSFAVLTRDALRGLRPLA